MIENNTESNSYNDIKPQTPHNYKYDKCGKTIEDASKNTEYIYNNLGLLTKLRVNKEDALNILYDASGNKLLEYNYNTKFATIYVRGANGEYINYKIDKGSYIKQKTMLSGGGYYQHEEDRTHYLLTDHLGNVRVTFAENNSGTDLDVLNITDYMPFGSEMPGRSYIMQESKFGFQGQEKLELADLYSFALRNYDTKTGLWTTPDPYMQHPSPYTAMSNNPVNHIDPDGGFDYLDMVNDFGMLGLLWEPDMYGGLVADVDDNGMSLQEYLKNEYDLDISLEVCNAIYEKRKNIGIVVADDFKEFGIDISREDFQTTLGAIGEFFSDLDEGGNSHMDPGSYHINTEEDYDVAFTTLSILSAGMSIGTGGARTLLSLNKNFWYGFGSATVDGFTQYQLNGGKFEKINVTSMLTAGLLKNSYLSSFVGGVLETNIDNGYVGLGNGKKMTYLGVETIVGGTFGYLGGQSFGDIGTYHVGPKFGYGFGMGLFPGLLGGMTTKVIVDDKK